MSKADKKKLEALTNGTIKLLAQLNALQKTFSQIKNEAEDLLRRLLKKSG